MRYKKVIVEIQGTQQAAVLPIFCLLYQVRFKCMAFYVAKHGKQVFIFFDRECLEPSLIVMPDSFGVVTVFEASADSSVPCFT
ncbi:hypothetical protein MFFC18_46000 [Mariniblastus fucicola]|uniref:Uncharacterized protein n=1 Tax=Mariniblastus fucicola TaxID=980251 RepID=A0A5B9PGE4_9BACT|nr:hypothetical protein MFFC18_46000 [Mariniblastus fucicola]